DLVQAGPIPDVGHAVASAWNGPLILTSWGFDLMYDVESSVAMRDRAMESLAQASLIFTDADHIARRAIALGAAADRLTQFPWGIDLAQFGPHGDNMRAAAGIEPGAWIVGCTRRHDPYYDVETVVRGFARFARTA